MDNACLIYSTHPSLEQARATAQALLDAKLSACCNILAPMESHYVWDGARAQAQEWPMLSKTTVSHAQTVITHIAALHPAECPAIVQIPVENGHPAFLQWIAQQTHSSR